MIYNCVSALRACRGLYYTADQLFGSDIQTLSDSKVKHQKCSKYSKLKRIYVVFLKCSFF